MTLDEKLKLLETHIQRWAPLLELDHWKIVLDVDHDDHTHAADEHESAVLSIHSDWRYRHAAIVAYAKVLEQEEPEDLEEYVVHELCHAVLCELRDQKKSAWINAEERTATILARSFVRTRRAADADAHRTVSYVIAAADAALAGKPAKYQKVKKQLAVT